MTCGMISFKGYIIRNVLWKRMEHYNSLLQLSLRLIKDRLLLLNRSCNYISANRQQSPSIRGGRQGTLLFKWSHKVPNESSSASSWGIKNRREQLTSSYSRFLRNRKMPDRLLGKRAAWSGVPGHMCMAYCQHFSDMRVHPLLLGGLYGQIAGPHLNFWFGRSVVAGLEILHPQLPRRCWCFWIWAYTLRTVRLWERNRCNVGMVPKTEF